MIRGDIMKKFIKLMLAMVILLSLLLSACAPPPPPISKIQLEQAEAEAIAAEENASKLENEMNSLEEEVTIKQAELKSLKDYKEQLEAGE